MFSKSLLAVEDYYAILEVSRTATTEEIKAAARKKLSKLHPDSNDGNRSTEAEYLQVTHAKIVLTDPAKRFDYDRGLPVSTSRATTPPDLKRIWAEAVAEIQSVDPNQVPFPLRGKQADPNSQNPMESLEDHMNFIHVTTPEWPMRDLAHEIIKSAEEKKDFQGTVDQMTQQILNAFKVKLYSELRNLPVNLDVLTVSSSFLKSLNYNLFQKLSSASATKKIPLEKKLKLLRATGLASALWFQEFRPYSEKAYWITITSLSKYLAEMVEQKDKNTRSMEKDYFEELQNPKNRSLVVRDIRQDRKFVDAVKLLSQDLETLLTPEEKTQTRKLLLLGYSVQCKKIFHQ